MSYSAWTPALTMWAKRPLTLCLLSLLACLLLGCQQVSSSSSSSSTMTVSQIIGDATNAGLTDTTFTYVQVNHWYGQDLHLQGTGYYTATPQRLKFVDMDATGSPLDSQIYVDQMEYFLGAGQTSWKPMPSPSATTMLNHFLPYALLSGPKLIGVEQVHGVSAYHIQGTIAGGFGPVVFDFWLNTTTYYPLQRATLVTQGQYTLAVTDTFSAWNTGVTIPIPANVGS